MTAGIGFTVSIFITALAFSEPDLGDQAKLGVLVASTIAAALAALVLSVRPVAESRPTS
jgi:NhaA family Na+:H+ antiporter